LDSKDPGEDLLKIAAGFVLQVPARQFPVMVHFSRKTELHDYLGAVMKKVRRKRTATCDAIRVGMTTTRPKPLTQLNDF
jgi:HrpA-like RNA helicase